MARIVHDIFLASPFEEFQLLRKILNIEINKMASRFPIALVDLNDGAVTHSPPLQECVVKAKQSDFMILLMGDTYGSYAPNQNKSYTHLEYQSVIYKNSPTIVLVFCIGDSYQNNSIKYSNDINFKDFQQSVEKHHTIGYFSKKRSIEEVGQKIIQELLIAVSMRVMNGHMIQDLRIPKVFSVDESKKKTEEKLPNVTTKADMKSSHKELLISKIVENEKDFSVENEIIEVKKTLENYVKEKGLGKLTYKTTSSKTHKYIFSIFLNEKQIGKYSGQEKISVENVLCKGTLTVLQKLKTQKQKQKQNSLHNKIHKSAISDNSVVKKELENYVKEKSLGKLTYKTTSSNTHKYIFLIFLNGKQIGKYSGQEKISVENVLYKGTLTKLQNLKTQNQKKESKKSKKNKVKKQLENENKKYIYSRKDNNSKLTKFINSLLDSVKIR